jgi:hypothetical protein
MKIREFDYELISTGENADVYFCCPSLDDEWYTINVIDYQCNTLYLMNSCRCESYSITCKCLLWEIDKTNLNDDADVQFVIEEIDGDVQYFSRISVPLKKIGNNVIIEVQK